MISECPTARQILHLVIVTLLLALLIPAGAAVAATTFNNPILNSAPDPFAMRYTDGNYYFMATTQTNLVLRKSATLTGIASGQAKTIWTPPASGVNCCEIWAPEIHRLDNKWYIYFTASSGGGDPTRRVNVLENLSADPMTGSWVLKGQVNTVVAGLDGTVVNFPGYYLRHRNGEIWLDRSDGSALFKGDATFWRRPGLANSAYVSFESYNFPGRYIRHRDWLLYNEAVSTTLARNDATFIPR